MEHPGTYQTRISEYAGIERALGDGALSAYAELYGRVERKLFCEVAAGRSATSLKREYLKRYGIPARMFNGVRVSLEGKVASVKEQQKLRLDSLRRRIDRAEAADRRCCRSTGGGTRSTRSNGRLANLKQSKLMKLEADTVCRGRVGSELRVETAVAQAVSPEAERLRKP